MGASLLALAIKIDILWMKTFKSYCFTQDKIVNIDKKTAKKKRLDVSRYFGWTSCCNTLCDSIYY